MKEVVYIKEHNNYPFKIGNTYKAIEYKEGWLLIDGQLYRSDSFTHNYKQFAIASIKK